MTTPSISGTKARPHKNYARGISTQFKVFKERPTANNLSLLNDVPPVANSAICYAVNDLRSSRVDSIPDEIADPFSRPTNYRELKSLQAVMKSVSGDTKSAVFSHMLILPDDLERVLGDDIVSKLWKLQKDVSIHLPCFAKKLS